MISNICNNCNRWWYFVRDCRTEVELEKKKSNLPFRKDVLFSYCYLSRHHNDVRFLDHMWMHTSHGMYRPNCRPWIWIRCLSSLTLHIKHGELGKTPNSEAKSDMGNIAPCFIAIYLKGCHDSNIELR